MLTVNRKPKFTNRKPTVIFGFETKPNRNRNSQNRTEPKTENLEIDQPLVCSTLHCLYYWLNLCITVSRLSLSNYASGVANQSPSILHATPIGFDLWQRHSNGITHIDSEGDTSDTFNANQSSPASDENYLSISAVAGPTTKQFCHPSSNYAYKKEPPIPRNKPAWHYPSGTDIVKYS